MYRIIGTHAERLPDLAGLVTTADTPVTRHRDVRVMPQTPSVRGPNMLYFSAGGVFGSDGTRVAESNFIRSHGSYFDPGEQVFSRPPAYLPAALYGGVLFNHYGHFLLESTARLWAPARGIGDGLPVVFLAAPNFQLEAYHEFLLRRLGLLDRLHICTEPLRVGELIVPAPAFRYREMADADAAFIEPFQRIAAQVAQRPRPRTYISRRKLDSAMSIPENEVEAMFRADGWDIACPEDLEMAEQVELFRNASQLAGLSGSGMHNQLYSPPGTRVVHINRFWTFLRSFFVIDELTGADSTHILGYQRMEPLPTDASGPFFLNIGRIHADLRAAGVLTTTSYQIPLPEALDGYASAYRSAAWLRRVQMARWQGNETARQDAIDQGMAEGVNPAAFLTEQALLLHDRGDFQAALDAMRRAIGLVPEDARILCNFLNIAAAAESADDIAAGLDLVLPLQVNGPDILMVCDRFLAAERYKDCLSFLEHNAHAMSDALVQRRDACLAALGRTTA